MTSSSICCALRGVETSLSLTLLGTGGASTDPRRHSRGSRQPLDGTSVGNHSSYGWIAAKLRGVGARHTQAIGEPPNQRLHLTGFAGR